MPENSLPAIQAHLPLRPVVFDILLALRDGPEHGFGIIQETARRTEGRVRLDPGTLYRALNRTLQNGLLEEIDEPGLAHSSGPARRYYRMTTLGRDVARAEAHRLSDLVQVARDSGFLVTQEEG
jgi:DNA-binding PadR family transcriptional regulator